MHKTVPAVGVLAAALGAALLAAPAPAAAQVGVDLEAGTLGITGGVSWGFAPQFAVRLEGSGLPSIGRQETAGDNRYRADLELASAAGLLDWHPAGGGFHVTAGAFYDDNRLEGDALPGAGGTYTIGFLRLPASEVGTLHARVDLPTAAPYLGIGWAPPPRAGGGWGFRADLGVMYQGRPRTTLTPEPPPGSILDTPGALALLAPAIAAEEAKIESKVEGYRYYPVLSLGLTYRF